MKLKKKLLIIALAGLSIPVLLIALNIGNQIIKSVAATGAVASKRDDAEKLVDRNAAGALKLLKDTKVAESDLGSSKVDVCYVTHADAGWFATNWYQDCYLRYVHGFNTKLTASETARKLAKNSESKTYFGTPTNGIVGWCDLFEKDYQTTLTHIPKNTRSDNYTCETPNPVRGLGSVQGPALQDKELSIKSYSTFEIGSIDISQNQIWITFDTHYYHEELGCGVGIMFCNNPRNNPVHPKL